ncbi:unnamed protein product, partial [Timema podura]|nr:unnamed protein product [Timema podura]
MESKLYETQIHNYHWDILIQICLMLFTASFTFQKTMFQNSEHWQIWKLSRLKRG